MLWTPMPEATINEYGDALCRKYYVRSSPRDARYDLINAKSQAASVQITAQLEFYRRIAGPHCFHSPGNRG